MLGFLGEAEESGIRRTIRVTGCLPIGTKVATGRSAQQLVLEVADPTHADALQHQVSRDQRLPRPGTAARGSSRTRRCPWRICNLRSLSAMRRAVISARVIGWSR